MADKPTRPGEISPMRRFLFVSAVLLSASLISTVSTAHAAASIDEALAKKDLTSLQTFLDQGQVDDVVKALLKSVQQTLQTDPSFTEKKIAMAGAYAEKITPPSVPAICADLRRIAESFSPEDLGSPLHEAFIAAAQNFASAPVVVAQGRPNLCEEALLQDDLLAQTPVRHVPPIIPPVPPPHPDSAD